MTQHFFRGFSADHHVYFVLQHHTPFTDLNGGFWSSSTPIWSNFGYKLGCGESIFFV